MLSKIVNHVVGKFAAGPISEAPFFTSLGYIEPPHAQKGAYASFDCDGNSYRVTCNGHGVGYGEVIIEQVTYTRS